LKSPVSILSNTGLARVGSRRRRAGRLRAMLAPPLAAFGRLASHRSGASALEYALLAAMVAIIIGVFFVSIGLPIAPIFNHVNAGLAQG